MFTVLHINGFQGDIFLWSACNTNTHRGKDCELNIVANSTNMYIVVIIEANVLNSVILHQYNLNECYSCSAFCPYYKLFASFADLESQPIKDTHQTITIECCTGTLYSPGKLTLPVNFLTRIHNTWILKAKIIVGLGSKSAVHCYCDRLCMSS